MTTATLTPPQVAWLRSFLPAPPSTNMRERLRACVGAGLGIVLTGAISAGVLGPQTAALWLMAPMGASAVLLFAVPSSPLAQPWSIVGGNLVSALIGVACSQLITARVAAAGAAIFLAIAAMILLRCLHPPSGAVALTAVLGGPVVQAAGYGFVAAPVALNSLLLLAVALLYNNATGRPYPQAQQLATGRTRPADAPGLAGLGYQPEDLQAALKQDNQTLDISPAHLEHLLRQTEMQAFSRQVGDARCGDIMSHTPHAVEFATELAEAWQLMHAHRLQALPVVDRWRRVIGVVSRADFLHHADLADHATLRPRLQAFLRRTAHSHSDKHEVVGQIMAGPVRSVPAGAPLAALLPLMADAGLHQVPVIDDERRLVGMVTQTQLVAALVKTSLGRWPAAAGPVDVPD